MSDDAQTGTAWTIAIASLVGNVFQWLFGWLNNRDKLRFDSELAALRNRSVECDAAHQAAKARLEKLEAALIHHLSRAKDDTGVKAILGAPTQTPTA